MLLTADVETTGYRMPPLLAEFVSALHAAGFAGDVADDPAARLAASTDNSIYQILPPLVLCPRTREDVACITRVASAPGFETVAFTARGGGTGTNGQSLTQTVVVDMSRYLNHIVEIDTRARRVRVEPGVVLGQLNARLAEHGLFLPLPISTASRATLGGMIGTDACGKGSRRYGRTHDYVESLRVALADGSSLALHSLTARETETGAAAGEPHAALAHRLRETAAPYRAAVIDTFPEMPRSLTGYNLRAAFPADGSVHLQHLLTGAEGTLGLVQEATLRIMPLPARRCLVVVRYHDFATALEDARVLLDSEPSAVETMDQRLVELARQDSAWHLVRHALAGVDDDGAPLVINFVEYEGASAAALNSHLARLAEALNGSAAIDHYVTHNGDEMAALWGLRARSVGMLGRQEGTRKPVPFIEDTVVPPESLPEYVAELRTLLDERGIAYAMFGHVDVGCLHVRPALDLTDPGDAALVRELSDAVVALLKRFRGLLWGEHGKGFRGEYARVFFGETLYPLLAEVKRACDPHNRMNPGKIVAPDGDVSAVTPIDQVPLRGQRDALIPVDQRVRWDKAIACNGNGVCFDWDARQAICPSYRVTRDRVHSPKGRAGLVREWLRQLAEQGRDVDAIAARWPRRARASDSMDFSHSVYDAMQGCLACKACASECPVHVNIPDLRARFLSAYHREYRRPARDHAAARIEEAAPLAAGCAPLVNCLTRSAFGQAVARRLGLVDLPGMALDHGLRRARRAGVCVMGSETLAALPAVRRERAVFVRPDAFTTYFDPAVLPAVCRSVAALGAEPVVLRYRSSGKALHVHGYLAEFCALARAEAERLRAVVALNRPLLGIDPSVALLYRDEYPRAVSDAPWGRAQLLQEWLNEAALPEKPAPHEGPAYRLLLHCTERTMHPESAALYRQIFKRLGLAVEVVETGCCGMAGIYGHQIEHQTHSWELYDLAWRPVVESAEGKQVLATGYSCRSQVRRCSGFRPAHPIEVVADRLEELECAA